MRIFSLLTLAFVLTACGTPPDLQTPCPDYGKHCPQTNINLEPLF